MEKSKVVNIVSAPTETPEENYYPPKGTGSKVPAYYKTNTKVPKKSITKEIIIKLIKNILTAKADYPEAISMENFFQLFLKKRFGKQKNIVEWSYNLVEECDKLKLICTDCAYFLLVLNEKIDAFIYMALLDKLDLLKKAISDADYALNGGKVKGMLQKDEFIKVIDSHYPLKSTMQKLELQKAVEKDQPSFFILYRYLFDIIGDSQFLETVKKQFHDERGEFITKISIQLSKVKDDIMTYEVSRSLLEEAGTKNTESLLTELFIESKKVTKKSFFQKVSFSAL